jgi:predicted nucleotidyltransferase
VVRPKIDIPRDRLAELCRRHRIHRLAFFGSVLRDDFGPSSDVDMLVEFEPGYSPGWDIIHVEEDFSRLFGGRKVDMLNPKYINRRLKDRILGSAVTQYEFDDDGTG